MGTDVNRIVNGVVDNLRQIDNAMNVIINMMTKNELPFDRQLIDPMIEVSMTIGLILVVAYWMIGFIKEITEIDWKHLSMWWYIRKIIQIILGKELVTGSVDICKAIFQLINSLVLEYQGAIDIPSMVAQFDAKAFKAEVEALGFMDRIMFNAELQTPKLVLMAVAVIIQMLAYYRTLRIGLLQISAPIRLATAVNGNFSGVYSFLQDYVGEVGQVLVIVWGMRLYANVVGDMMMNVSQSGTNTFIKLILASVMLLAVILGAVPFAKSLIGR